MKKLRMLVEFEYDELLMYGNDEGKSWFFNEVLLTPQEGNDLFLHSNEIGDEVGHIKVIQIFENVIEPERESEVSDEKIENDEIADDPLIDEDTAKVLIKKLKHGEISSLVFKRRVHSYRKDELIVGYDAAAYSYIVVFVDENKDNITVTDIDSYKTTSFINKLITGKYSKNVEVVHD